jgi:phosphopantetheinyl transferase
LISKIPLERIIRIKDKFLNEDEKKKWSVDSHPDIGSLTLLWNCKEAVFKWYGDGGVDFSDQIHLLGQNHEKEIIDCHFTKNDSRLSVHYRTFEHLTLAWVFS